MNTLNSKMSRKINYIRTWSSGKAEFRSKITTFLPLQLEYTKLYISNPEDYCFFVLFFNN